MQAIRIMNALRFRRRRRGGPKVSLETSWRQRSPPPPPPPRPLLLLLLWCGCLVHGSSTATGVDDDIHSATFVVTQAGLNNAPALYSQFLTDAIVDANAKMRQPRYWCGIADGQEGCSGCVCQIKNQGVDLGVHLDMTTGRSPRGRHGDFFALAGDASSIKLDILPAGDGYIGAVRMTTMIAMGFNIPFEGSSLTGGGFFGICCAGFIWFHHCSCVTGCGCKSMCSVQNPGIEATAITELQVTILIHHDPTTGALSASMDGCPGPGGNCLKAPHLADDLAIKCGCMGDIYQRIQDSWMLQFLSWISGQGSVSSIAKKMLDAAKAMIVPKINEKLREQLPMVAPQSCGAECGLPPDVEMSYKMSRAPSFVEKDYIEAQIDIHICTRALRGQTICFPPHDPFPPPGYADQPYQHYSGTMLAGMRVSSSLMNGVSWAMGNSNMFVTVGNITLLDASLAFNVSWAEPDRPPVLKVPNDDLMEFEWSNGFVRVQCHSMPSVVDMLDFKWAELVGNGTFNHTLGGCNAFNQDSCECTGKHPNGLDCNLHDKCSNFGSETDCARTGPVGRCVWSQNQCMANTCAFPQVSWFDTTRSELMLVSPKLPVPNKLLTEAMKSALQSAKGQLNNDLEANAMCLPPGMAKYLVPPPTVHMYKQHTTEHPGHGFLELISFCGSSPGQQPCLANIMPPASGKGGTDCLPGSNPAVSTACVRGLADLSQHMCSPYQDTPACQRLAQVPLTQCTDEEPTTEFETLQAHSPDVRHSSVDTYVANGLEYSAGVYTYALGTSCVDSCVNHKKCHEQHFQNDTCSEFSVRSCVGDTYVEKTYKTYNCTGDFESKNFSAGICITTRISGTDQNVSMQVVCPQAIEHQQPERPRHTMAWVVLALAGVALCICCRLLCQHDRFRGAISRLSETSRCDCTVIDNIERFCVHTTECLQRVSSSSCRWLRQCNGEALLRVSVHCTAAIKYATQRLRRCWAQFWTVSRGLSYSPRQHLGVHDWMHVLLMILAAAGYATHLLLWHLNDPFAAFDRNIIAKVGLGEDWVDARPVQNHFAQWSHWGQSCQGWSSALIMAVTLIGLIDQVTPKQRNTLWMTTLAVVVITQAGVLLVPSFLFEFSLEICYNQNRSFPSDPETKSEADAALSLAFDGVALTFVSTLFVFMLHGIAPGVFIGSCVFSSHLMSLKFYQTSTSVQLQPQPPFATGLNVPLRGLGQISGGANHQSFGSFTGSHATVTSERFFTFAIGSRRFTNAWLAPRRATQYISNQVLTQQGPRVRIINWLSTLGAPCGGCLPVIIIYQSLGADTWWALMWSLCWVAPAVLMLPLSRALEMATQEQNSKVNALTSGTTALCYITLYGIITAAILRGLVDKAHSGGFQEFTVEFPTTTFISSMLGTMALTLSYLETSILQDSVREHIGDSMREHIGDHIGSVGLNASQASQSNGTAANQTEEEFDNWSAPVSSSVNKCVSSVWRWLIETDEQMDPHRYGRRLPTRRVQLIVGLCLSVWVLGETYHDSDGFKDQYVLSNVKELMSSLDSGLQWPEGNATVLDGAFDVYGKCCKAAFILQIVAVTLLVCACWCDSTVREYHGLQASRVFGFVGLAAMFCSSLIPAAPNYLRISTIDTLCPCCARQFNFAITTLLQDLVGIVCSGLFAFRLLPVLLIVVPSMVRACTLLLVDDILRCNQDVKDGSLDQIIANYADPAFSRSNVHSVLALCSMLTPLFTAIPMTVAFQLLRRYDQGVLLTTMVMIFYAVPIVLGMMRCDTVKRVEARYIAWMLGYFVPLLVMLLYEAAKFGFMDQVKDRLLDPTTYAEILAEMGLANVILSDIMYSNLYVERRRSDMEAIPEVVDNRVDRATEPQQLCEARTAAVSRPASPSGFVKKPSTLNPICFNGYDQVLQDASATLVQSQLGKIPGFATLEALRRANRDDLVNAGLDAAQAAALFAALGRYDARQLVQSTGPTNQASELGPEPEPELEPEQGQQQGQPQLDRIDTQNMQRGWIAKLVLLIFCPLLLLTCAILSSLQALRYVDYFPWINRMVGFADSQSSEALDPYPVATNGHPCPWEL